MSAVEVPEGFPKLRTDQYGRCECALDDCTLQGRYKKPFKNGTRHIRGCKCRQCIGSASSRMGKKKQRMVGHRVGANIGGLGAGHEENWSGPVRTEVKSGARDAGVVRTAYERERAQSEASKSIGDTRPFMASYAPKGTTHSYHVIRDDDLTDTCVALLESEGWIVSTP